MAQERAERSTGHDPVNLSELTQLFGEIKSAPELLDRIVAVEDDPHA